MRTLAILITSAAFAAAAAPVALASQASPGNPNGTGQPNQSCQTQDATVGGLTGGLATNLLPSIGAANAPGSVFNEQGQLTSSGTVSSGGTGGNQYNLVGAPSQYDVACFQTSTR